MDSTTLKSNLALQLTVIKELTMGMNAHYHLGVVIRFGKTINVIEEKTLCSNEECARSHPKNELEKESRFCVACGSPTNNEFVSKSKKTPELHLEALFSEEELEEKDYDMVVSETREGGEKNVFLSCIENTYISFDKYTDPENTKISPQLLEMWISNFKSDEDVKALLNRINNKYGAESYSVEVALTCDYR